jgi:hypothetical protein
MLPMLRMTSPGRSPAAAAGEARLTSGTSTPGLNWLSATPTVLTCAQVHACMCC